MIPTSEKFKNDIREYGRQIALRISYDDIVLEKEDIRQLTKTFKASLFKACMQIIECEIKGSHDLKNKTVKIEFGVKNYDDENYEFIDWGIFVIDNESVEYKVDKNTTKFTAYDKICKLHIEYELEDIVYPITVKNYLKKICNTVGIEFDGNVSFANQNRLIEEEKFLPIPESTYRDAVDTIAGVAGGIIIISNNKLCVRYPAETNIVIDKHSLRSFSVLDKWGPIESVALVREPQKDNIVHPENANGDLPHIRIINNQIMDKNREDYIVDIYNRMKGFYIYPFKIQTAYGFFEPYDVVRIQDLEGNEYQSPIMNSSIKITTGIIEDIETEKPEVADTDYSKASSIYKTILNTQLMVDKQNGIIQAVVDETKVQSDKVSDLTIDVDSIKTQVEEINNHNIVFNFNGEQKWDGWSFVNELLYPAKRLGLSNKLLPVIKKSPTFYIKEYPNSKSETGLFFDNGGVAITAVSKVLAGDTYSFRCKREEFTSRFTLFVSQYGKDKEFIKETIILDTIQPRSYESGSVVLEQNTQYVSLKFQSYDNSHFSISECMFNRGVPREFERTADDAYYYAKSEINQLSGQIQLRVSKDEFASEINQLSNNISLKVGNNEVVSAINMSPEEIKILASKLKLEGITTINNKVVIGMDGKLQGDQAEFTNGTFSGTVKASNFEGGSIDIGNGNFTVNNNGHMSSNGGGLLKVNGNHTNGQSISLTVSSGKIAFQYANEKEMALFASGNYIIGLNERTDLSQLEMSSHLRTHGSMIADYMRTTKGVASSGPVEAPSFPQTSDRRLKENITEVDYSGVIDELKVKKYNFISNKQTQLGLLAQDVQLTEIGDFAVANLTTNTSELENPLALDYNNILMVAVQALQETRKEVKKLREEAKCLRKELGKIKKKQQKPTQN